MYCDIAAGTQVRGCLETNRIRRNVCGYTVGTLAAIAATAPYSLLCVPRAPVETHAPQRAVDRKLPRKNATLISANAKPDP